MSQDTVAARPAIDRSRGRRRDEAARWFVMLQHAELSPRVLNDWKKWEAVPENREAFDAVERVWESTGSMSTLSPSAPEERATDSYDGSVSVSSWNSRRTARSGFLSRHRLVKLTAKLTAYAAATAAVAFLLQWMYYGGAAGPLQAPSVVYETGLAEHRELVLADGTRIHLGAQTSVTASITARSRSVVLDRGEALFKIARDPQRPFRVNAGGGIITAVGTAFNVRRRENHEVVVTVSEGIVEVTSSATTAARGERNPQRDAAPSVQRLVRGQEVTYDAVGRISPVRVVEADTSAAWRDGRLSYHSEPLSHVIQDINRYSSRQLILSDPAAGNFLYSGTVFEREIDDWVAGLDKIYPEISVVITADSRVLIRTRAAAAQPAP